MIHKVLAEGLPIKAGAGVHPSVKLESCTGGSPEELASNVQCPMLFESAANDPDNVKEKGAVSTIRLEKFPTSVVQTFPDQSHGWVTRGDVRIPTVGCGALSDHVQVKDLLSARRL